MAVRWRLGGRPPEAEPSSVTSRALIVGANSFLSRALGSKLLELGQEVEGIYRKNRDRILEGMVCHQTDRLTTLEDRYDVVYIVSAYVPRKSAPDTSLRLFRANVGLTEDVVQQFPSARFVYASSVSVYGDQDGVVDETTTLANPGAYGISKFWGEQVVRSSDRFAIARISSMYGEGMSLTTFIPRLITQALEKGVVTVWGDGKRQQNYVSVEAVASMMIEASKRQENGTYLAVGPQSHSNLEIAKIVAAATTSEIEFTGTDSSPSFHYENANTIQALGPIAHAPIENDLARLLAWIKRAS